MSDFLRSAHRYWMCAIMSSKSLICGMACMCVYRGSHVSLWCAVGIMCRAACSISMVVFWSRKCNLRMVVWGSSLCFSS